VEEQKRRQEDGEPRVLVVRREEDLEGSEYFGNEPCIEALAPDAVELGDDHAWH
jgi:hypothetical protein